MIGEQKLYIFDDSQNVVVYNYNKYKLKAQE
jgi:hypothetical protein